MQVHTRKLRTVVSLLVGLWAGSQVLIADPGLTIDASAMRFVYTPGAGGPGSIGRIDITPSSAAALVVQEVQLGSDNAFGGGDDTVVDLASAGADSFTATFSADVFSLGPPNSYAVVGTYAVTDSTAQTVVEGDFVSNFASIGGQSMFMGGTLTNADGILRPGSPSTGWVYTGSASQTMDFINGVFGGRDGIDGTVTLTQFRNATTLASLFNFQFVGAFPDLDAFFNSGIQACTVADVKVTVVAVPAPGAAFLGALGLMLVDRIRRRYLS